MANTSVIRGSKFERDVLQYLRGLGRVVERLVKAGSKDEGDLVDLTRPEPLIIEAKARRQFDVAAAVRESKVERLHYAEARGLDPARVRSVALLKAPGKGIGQAYVVIELDDFLRWYA